MNDHIAIFEGKKIRKVWDKRAEKWYFSVVDVVDALTESKDARKYWNKLAQRLRDEGSEVVTKCHQLKLQSSDGKFYTTDTADTEVMFRIIQSIPSPNAEPFKMWLAKVGYERIEEIQDPEKSLNRARENWQKYGRSEKWIQQRMMGQETRNKLTDYWKEHEVTKQEEFAILTNVIHQEWSGISVGKHKDLKGLDRQNLRDHMSEAELIFTALAELSTRQIAEKDEAYGFIPNKVAGIKGGGIAKNARKELEDKTGKSVVTGNNFLSNSNPQIHSSRGDIVEVDANKGIVRKL
jgi:DNA-damage-inducible protein D